MIPAYGWWIIGALLVLIFVPAIIMLLGIDEWIQRRVKK